MFQIQYDGFMVESPSLPRGTACEQRCQGVVYKIKTNSLKNTSESREGLKIILEGSNSFVKVPFDGPRKVYRILWRVQGGPREGL